MIQRFDIARNKKTDSISIREFAVLETRSHKRHDYNPTEKDYSLIHEVSYDGDIIRDAIGAGHKALISALRSRDFFPIYPCIELIANSVTSLFNGNSGSILEVFFDDRTTLSTYGEE